ncbi:hypothetical protein, partial [Kitasatospora sp. NPDC057223]|uniref:hypothetical protein n=1 Tax=Kitasatospora sp. NPDC057223 TaxID=3346055 RepID=UPI00363A634F
MKRGQEKSAVAAPGSPIEYDADVARSYQALLNAKSTAPAAQPVRTAAPTPVSAPNPAGEPSTKRAKGPDGSAATPPRLTREPSNLIAQPHQLPKMARVTLRPSLEFTPEHLIQRVVISPGHRTPSPFGSRMGDHTVAWQAVVDALRASLYGLNLSGAIGILEERQHTVAGWMTQPKSTGKTRLALLPDAAHRSKRLEDAAYRVTEYLKAAGTALRAGNQAEAVEAFERAVAHHLTYVNYLPFSTVPVHSSGGSKGSGEGSYRKVLLDTEAPGSAIDRGAEADDFAAEELPDEAVDDEDEEDDAESSVASSSASSDSSSSSSSGSSEEDEPPAPVDRPTRLREALWKLFSFEAALRAARTRAALQPSTDTDVAGEHTSLEKLVRQLIDQLDLTPKVRRTLAAKGRVFAPGLAYDHDTVVRLGESAKALRARFADDPEKDHLRQLAGTAGDLADAIARAEPNGFAAGTADTWRKKLGTYRTPAQVAADKIIDAAQDALPNAALVLAYLLHDHQVTMATAYPKSVTESGFLTTPAAPASGGTAPVTGPATAAIARLRAEIVARAARLPAEDTVLKELLTATRKAYEALYAAEPVPAPDLRNGWAVHRAAEALVVAYTPTPANGAPYLEVNGRAPAPRGVAGMGSHTTAWLVEVAATDVMVAVPTETLAGFRAAVKKDLGSAVMRLDCLLPVDQLRGGQLRLLFNTAVKVLESTTVKEAAAQYLRFRNLLPFATVDAGDRGGHGEDLTRSSYDLFDTGSLRHAAELHDATLASDSERAAVARDLATLGSALANRPAASWGLHDEVLPAVVACSRRLADQSTRLMAGRPANVVETILGVRWAEHEETFKRAQFSRMVINARAAKVRG